ncbi:MAG: CARDB domain-containing protein, partial [Candidatus Kariarchaeaceae archaeon]
MNKTILLSVLIFSLLFATLVYSLGTYTLLVSVYEYGTANELVANITVFNSTDDWSCINCNRYPWAVSLYSGAYTIDTTSQGYLPNTKNIEINDRDMGLNIYLKPLSPDTEAPQWSNLKEFPLDSADYAEGQTYWFNITWTDNVAVDNVLLELNGLNHSVDNIGNEYYKTFDNLNVGLYLYTWYANDTSDNWNSIDSNYTINKTDPVNQTHPSESLIHLSLNGEENDMIINYSESTATGWKEFTEGESILYRDGIEVDRGQTPVERTTLPADNVYNYTLYFPETTNYKEATITRFLTVEKADPFDPSDPQNSIIHLAINGIEDDVTIVNGTESNVTGWVEQGDAGAVTELYQDGSSVSNPDIQTLPEGTYVYNFTYDETENYTAGFVIRTLTVTQPGIVTKPDLEVSTSDIVITPSVQQGDYEIEITVHNIGNETATSVYYEVYDNSVLLENKTLSSVIDGDFETRTFLWAGPSVGLHTIELRVDPNNKIDEWDESNNIASLDFMVPGDDTEAPQCSNFVADPVGPTVYAPGKSYQFNCTWTDNVQVGTVIFELSGTNYSASNDGDVYYITFTDLPADLYYATWYANDTNDNWNVTSTMVYNVTQVPTTIILYLNGTESNKNYLHNEFANFTVALDVSGKTVNLDTNMTDWVIQSGITPLEVITNLTEKGYFNVTGYFDGDQNYTAANKTLYISVNGGDITPPNITIVSPKNISYYGNNDILLIYTVDEPTDWVGYSLDSGPNVTIPGNTTIENVPSGSHYLILYGNDTSGNMGFDDVYFTMECLSYLMNSFIDGTYYNNTYQNIHDLSNVVCSELFETNITVSNISDSYLNVSLIDNSEILNATVQNCSIIDSTFEGDCTDTFIDP